MLVFLVLVYVCFKLMQSEIDVANRREYSRRNGYDIYFDDFGRSRDVLTGNICHSTLDGLYVYNKKTGKFEKRK